MAKKVYVCEICPNHPTFEHKSDLRHHEKWNTEHGAAQRKHYDKLQKEAQTRREREEAIEILRRAKRPTLLSYGDVNLIAEELGIKRELVYLLHRHAQHLEQDVKSLVSNAKSGQNRLETLLRDTNDGRFYGGTLNSSSFGDIPALEAKIAVRRDMLVDFAYDLGVRLRCLQSEVGWKFEEVLRRFTVTKRDVLIEDTDKWFVLTVNSLAETAWDFDTEGEAALEAVTRTKEIIRLENEG